MLLAEDHHASTPTNERMKGRRATDDNLRERTLTQQLLFLVALLLGVRGWLGKERFFEQGEMHHSRG